MRILFILFVIMPIIEMWLLIEVGSHIGALSTIGLVVLTAFIGVILLRQQGTRTFLRARSRLQQGEIPAREMVDGLFLGVAGALLLTPGFFTDLIGFFCLIPGIRLLVIGFFGRHISSKIFKTDNPTVFGSTFDSKKFADKTNKNRTLEGEIDNHDERSD